MNHCLKNEKLYKDYEFLQDWELINQRCKLHLNSITIS